MGDHNKNNSKEIALSTASTPAREADELDALLERTAAGSVAAPAATASPTDYTSIRASIEGEDGGSSRIGHRKSHTVGGGGNFLSRTGDRVRGLFGKQANRNQRSHRKNKSSISDLIHDAMGSVNFEPIREDFLQTASSVKHIWLEELEEMHQGSGTGFFDMTATRSFAILPDDLPDLGSEARLFTSSIRRLQRIEEVLPRKEEEEEEEGAEMAEEGLEKKKIASRPDRTVLIVNLLMLLGAVFAHSSNATALHMLNGVSPTMKLFWRMSASYLILIPFALIYLRREGLPKMSFSGWTIFVSASLFYTLSTMCFYWALEYTTIGNAVIYANSQALLLIIGKVFVGEQIHVLEGIGVVVAFSGAILCSKDSEHSSREADLTNALVGDLLALCAAAFGVAYLTVAKAVRSQMSVIFFITTVMFVGSIMVLVYLASNPHEEVSFDMDPFHGIFGGFDVSHHRLEVLAYLAIVVNVGGSMGFIRAMQHFDTIVIAVGTLMEPLAASFIAFICHAGLLPGPLGWLGNFLVVVGTLGVVYPSMGKNESGMH
jgi:drug/metabolite transporter (DMT)-like permease